jgi:S1 RNA binding domain protein
LLLLHVSLLSLQMRYQHALAAVQEVEGRGIVQGEVYRVRVLKVVDFGAYVALPNGLPALLHVSQLSHEKIREVRDVVAEGEEFDVVCKGRDSKGFVQLSRKDLLPVPEGLQLQQQQPVQQPQQQPASPSAGSSSTSDLAAAVAAAAGAALGSSSSGSSGSSSSLGRQSQQHHVHHSNRPPSKPARTPRAMTWRPSPGTEGEQQQ